MFGPRLAPPTNHMTEELRIGLYICHCGHNIAAVVRPGTLAGRAQTLPGVVVCRHHLYTCSEAGQREIAADIRESRLNRVVVAACSPKLHEFTFRRVLQDAGLNPYLLEMVNIREQCSWVHGHDPAAAEDKALDLIRMGLAKVRLAAPLATRQVPLTRRALVIGGGAAGLRAALDIAGAGYPVVLVERQPLLGGMASRLFRTFPHGQSALSLINPLMAAAVLHPEIQILTGSEVVAVTGHLGNFQVTVRQAPLPVTDACDGCGLCTGVCPLPVPAAGPGGPGRRAAIHPPPAAAFPSRYLIDREHCDGCGLCVPVCPAGAIDLNAAATTHRFTVGALVVATGFTPYNPREGGPYEAWTADPRVITTLELETLLAADPTAESPLTLSGPEGPRDAAFVLCVGSREETGHRYCSRVCCPTALHQALELRARFPNLRIRIYYRDMRTIKPAWEDLYTRAREAGIQFLRGQVREVAPESTGRVRLRAANELLGGDTEDVVDLAVLAVGMTPGEGRQVKEVLKLPLSDDGFFLEAHPKLRPLETALDCVFLAGACQGPKDLSESLTQGSGAAAKILSLFAHDSLTLEGVSCEVNPDQCQACGQCVRQCPFQAVEMVEEADRKFARIISSACKGCGVCAGACVAGAVIAHGFTDQMILAQIDAALERHPERKILAFCCNWCSYAGADFAGVSRLQYPPAVRIIRTMCAGRVRPMFIWYAFAKGAARVLVTGCHPPGDCHYLSGNLRAQARIERLKPKLAAKGIDPERLQLAWVSATEGRAFARLVTDMARDLETHPAPPAPPPVDLLLPELEMGLEDIHEE